MKVDLIKVIVFDFDCAFTDDFVDTDSAAKESVRCSSEDNLGLYSLKKEISKCSLNIRSRIFSPKSDEAVAPRVKKRKLSACKE